MTVDPKKKVVDTLLGRQRINKFTHNFEFTFSLPRKSIYECRLCIMCSHIRYNYISIGVEQIKTCKKIQQNRHLLQCMSADVSSEHVFPKFPRATKYTVIIIFLRQKKHQIAINGVVEIYTKNETISANETTTKKKNTVICVQCSCVVELNVFKMY